MTHRTDYYHVSDAPVPTLLVPAVSAIVHEGGTAIILHRRTDSGLWSLPGGKVEVGETVSECCEREVAEETGLIVSVNCLIGIYSDPGHVISYSDGEIRQQFSVCLGCRVIGGQLALSSESTEVAWFSASELPTGIHPAQEQRISDWLSERLPVLR